MRLLQCIETLAIFFIDGIYFFFCFLTHQENLYGHAQKSVYSLWAFVDIDILTQFVISSRPMLFLPKYIYCSKITKVIDILAFQNSILKDALGTEI